jgi:hypothetical protein
MRMSQWNLVVCPERQAKQGMVMQAIRRGMRAGELVINDADAKQPFMVCGQLWAAQRMISKAETLKTPYWVIDNGYYKQSGKNRHETGHWEFTYRGLEPIVLRDPDPTRLPYKDHVKPWRQKRGDSILVGIPGLTFGRAFGWDMRAWVKNIEAEIRKYTDRPIRYRDKWSGISAELDVLDCHALVTHSSHVAIDAVRQGVPAIVAPTSPAAPVCSTSLADIETPLMPDREHWWASLMSQQFTLQEIKDGIAWKWQKIIMEQVDGKRK